MRVWDDTAMRYIDISVVWDGSGGAPSPAELHTRQCWLQREAAYATKHGSARTGEYITQAEARGKGVADVRFAATFLPKTPAIKTSSELKREDARAARSSVERAHCRGCRARVPVVDLTAKLRLCVICKPGRQRAIRYPAA